MDSICRAYIREETVVLIHLSGEKRLPREGVDRNWGTAPNETSEGSNREGIA